MTNLATDRWGQWVRRRAVFLGIVSMNGLAKAVGCSSDQMRKWRNMSAPPAIMRKGFDSALMCVLKTDRTTLFRNYRSIPPESAPIVEPSMMSELEPNASRRRLAALMELMPENRLAELAAAGERLLRESMLNAA